MRLEHLPSNLYNYILRFVYITKPHPQYGSLQGWFCREGGAVSRCVQLTTPTIEVYYRKTILSFQIYGL